MPPEPPRMGFAPSEGLIEAAEPDESENPFQRRSNGTLRAGSRSASPSRLTPSPNATPTGEGRLSVASQSFGGSLGRLRSSNSSTSTLANSLKAGMSDADFDKALFKFAAERESFLEDLSFSAGTIVNNKPVIHPRAQKVINDDGNIQKAPSLRRRISLRDLSSMRRAPSVVNRAGNSPNTKLCIPLLLTLHLQHQLGRLGECLITTRSYPFPSPSIHHLTCTH